MNHSQTETSPSSAVSTDRIAALLTGVATGEISANDALLQLVGNSDLATAVSNVATSNVPASPDRVNLDLDRQRRCGFPEVIYGAGKPAEMVAGIIRAQQAAGQPSFATRISAEIAQAIQKLIPDSRYNSVGRTLTAGEAAIRLPCPVALESQESTAAQTASDKDECKPERAIHVAVITAGSTDAPVAEEAIETLHWMGIPFRAYDDIGVAGPERLRKAVPDLRKASAAIVIAGMEGALPAAVGGHLDVPIFAVPTSVGYGATLGGLTPLMGMLSSCSSNVAVVNIDAGFKAAYLSGLVIRPLLD